MPWSTLTPCPKFKGALYCSGTSTKIPGQRHLPRPDIFSRISKETRSGSIQLTSSTYQGYKMLKRTLGSMAWGSMALATAFVAFSQGVHAQQVVSLSVASWAG